MTLHETHALELPDTEGKGNFAEGIEQIDGGYKIYGRDNNGRAKFVVLKEDGSVEGLAFGELDELEKIFYNFRGPIFQFFGKELPEKHKVVSSDQKQHELKRESFLYKVPLSALPGANPDADPAILVAQMSARVKSLLNKDSVAALLLSEYEEREKTAPLLCEYDPETKMFRVWVSSKISTKPLTVLEKLGPPKQQPIVLAHYVIDDTAGFNYADGIERLSDGYKIYGRNMYDAARYLILRDNGDVEGYGGKTDNPYSLSQVEKEFYFRRYYIFEHFGIPLPNAHKVHARADDSLVVVNEKPYAYHVDRIESTSEGGYKIHAQVGSNDEDKLSITLKKEVAPQFSEGAVGAVEREFYHLRVHLFRHFKMELPKGHEELELLDEKGIGNKFFVNSVVQVNGGYQISGHDANGKPQYLRLGDQGAVQNVFPVARDKLNEAEKAFYDARIRIFEFFKMPLPTCHKRLALSNGKCVEGTPQLIEGGYRIYVSDEQKAEGSIDLKNDGTFEPEEGITPELAKTLYRARSQIFKFYDTPLPEGQRKLTLEGVVVEGVERIDEAFKIYGGHDEKGKLHCVVLRDNGDVEGAVLGQLNQNEQAFYDNRAKIFEFFGGMELVGKHKPQKEVSPAMQQLTKEWGIRNNQQPSPLQQAAAYVSAGLGHSQ